MGSTVESVTGLLNAFSQSDMAMAQTRQAAATEESVKLNEKKFEHEKRLSMFMSPDVQAQIRLQREELKQAKVRDANNKTYTNALVTQMGKKNSLAQSNLGLAQADQIRETFRTLGDNVTPEKRVMIKGQLMEMIESNENMDPSTKMQLRVMSQAYSHNFNPFKDTDDLGRTYLTQLRMGIDPIIARHNYSKAYSQKYSLPYFMAALEMTKLERYIPNILAKAVADEDMDQEDAVLFMKNLPPIDTTGMISSMQKEMGPIVDLFAKPSTGSAPSDSDRLSTEKPKKVKDSDDYQKRWGFPAK